MTTKHIGSGFKISGSKSGKVVVVRKAPRMAAGQAANKHQQAAREEKAWKAKSKSTS